MTSRVATFEWHTPSGPGPTEQVVVYDDGSAWLLAQRPRVRASAVGAYRSAPVPADLATLTDAGPGPVVLDPSTSTSVSEAAERVAAEARDAPAALAEFSVRASATGVSLFVVASGTTAVEFQLEPNASVARYRGAGGVELGTQPLPDLPTGFVTADAEGLGGVGRAARVEPEAYGAIAFDLVAPAGAETVSLELAGALFGALPDQQTPEPFGATTDPVPLG